MKSVAVLLAVLALLAAGCSSDSESNDPSGSDVDDVDLILEACGPLETGDLIAGGTITNTSGEALSVEVKAQFYDTADEQIAESSTFVDELVPGEATFWEVASGEQVESVSDVTCQVQAVLSDE